MERRKLYTQYRNLLLEGIVPFWLTRGVDWEKGGVRSCMTDDGTLINSEKFIWSQARSLWTFSALYNRIEKREEFLRAAANSARFLLAHGRDDCGRWVYRTDREGDVIEGAISVYADCFAVYGLSEYFRASGNEEALTAARETFDRVRLRVESPNFLETAPYQVPAGRKIHAIPMILLEVANELAQTTGDPAIEAAASDYLCRIMTHFVRPGQRVILEFLDAQYRELPPPEGSFVSPGHAIESMWFVLHWARRKGDADVIRRAVEAIRWHVEAGWDPVYGGMFLGIDAQGGAPFLPHSEKKLWWPHTEALYALLLAYELTGESWCLDWYERVHEWAFRHFAMPETGEWRQRLDRTGQPTDEVVALPVKDPFHLPRAAILIHQLLEAA